MSNTFSFQWPPFSGRIREYPELDQVAWFDPVEARRRIKEPQIPFLDRLEANLGLAVPLSGAPRTGPQEP